MTEENKENKSTEDQDEGFDANQSFEEESKESIKNDEEKSFDQESSEEESEEKKEYDAEEKTIEGLEKELEETKDKMLRVLAESENTRKQIEKNRIDMAKYGVQPLARELVNILDNFDRALNSLSETGEKKTLEGFELIKKEISNILDKFNVKKIDALGQTFDANLHQAMFEKPTKDFNEGVVCEIVQDGYKFHERLLRPAMVGIAKNDHNKEEDYEKKEESPNNEKEKN